MTVQNRFNPADQSTQHERIAFHGNRFAQASEINELQDVLLEPAKRAWRAQFADGDIAKGATLTLSPPVANLATATLTAGEIFLDSQLREVPAASLSVSTVGTVTLGVYLRRATITHLDDPRLKGMADGSRAFSQPGADRVHVSCNWGLQGDGQNGDFYGVYEINDGIVKPRQAAGQTSAIERAIEAYDVRSAGGTYRIDGMAVTMLDDADGLQNYMVGAGQAHVNGRVVQLPVQRRVRIDPRPDLGTVDAEPFASASETLQHVTVTRPPIVGVPVVSATVRKTVTLTRGNGNGGADALAAGAIAIESITQNATTYHEPADYKLNAGQVDWSPSGAEPAPGSTYNVTFREQVAAPVQNLTATGFDVAGALPGTTILTRYQFARRRFDRLCIDAAGDFQLVRGQPDDWNPVPPAVPLGLLALCTIRQWWVNRVLVDDGTAMVPMEELQGIKAQLGDFARQLADMRLATDVAARYGGQAEGQYADPMADDTMRDHGRMQTGVIGQGVLQLPSGIDGINVDTGSERHTIAHTQQPWLSQLLQTGTIKPNGTGITQAAPTTATLAPSVDRWVVKEVIGLLGNAAGAAVWVDGRLGAEETARRELLTRQGNAKTFMREQPVTATLTSFKPGEQVTAVEFAGVPANIANRTPANQNGDAACTFNVPPGVLVGTVAVVITGSAGSKAVTQYTATASFQYTATIMYGERGFGGARQVTVTL